MFNVIRSAAAYTQGEHKKKKKARRFSKRLVPQFLPLLPLSTALVDEVATAHQHTE